MLKLKKSSQFQKVYKKGSTFRENNIILSLLANNLDLNRLGVTVSAKRVPLSVRRNRTKRLISESHRLTERLLKKGYDMVITSKRDISPQRLNDVMGEVQKLYKKAGILV